MTGKPLRLFVVLALLAPTACRDEPIEPIIEDDRHIFAYTAPASAPAVQSISVRGTFNGWNETALEQQPDGSWRVPVELEDGTHHYKYYINGDWPHDMCHHETWGHADHDFWIDPGAAGCVDDGFGGGNAVLFMNVTPGLAFTHTATSPAHVSGADGRLSIRFRVTANQVQSATLTAGGQSVPMHLQLSAGLEETWRVSIPEGPASYSFNVTTATGTTQHGPYDVPGNLFRAVSWVGDGIGYQIFPERFWNGDPSNDEHGPATDAYHFLHPSFRHSGPVLTEEWDGPMANVHCCHQYFGGDLQGIIDRLDQLQALGVTLIYLNPIFVSGSAHGYDGFDFLQVAPNFGDEQTLRALLDAAHARGMRLMWDFVPNHVGVGHWKFQDAVEHGEDSPYWDWFRFHVAADQVQVGNGSHYDGWWGIGSLPELHTANPDVHEHLMEVTRYWTEFGFDGIRVDVPESIRNRQQFFPAFRQAAKAVNPDVYLVGEVWGRAPDWLRGDEFDSLMNYALGLEVFRDFVVGAIPATTAARDITRLYVEYPEATTAMQFNLISSHDTSRLLTLVGGGTLGMTPSAVALNRQRLASAMLYALPGLPVTFQGDECAFLGTAGSGDQHRYPVQWDACNTAMRDHYLQLGQLRQNLAPLRSPVIRLPSASGTVVVFFRGEPGPGEVLAVFNGGNSGQTFTLPAGSWADAVGGHAASGTLELAALGWRYLVRQ